jgi:hypothetical protein
MPIHMYIIIGAITTLIYIGFSKIRKNNSDEEKK